MNLNDITPVLISFNERENIARTLSCLREFPRVIVVDSGSTDETEELIRGFANVTIYQHPFDSHASQWTYAVSNASTDWVLTLDADYQVGSDLLAEIKALVPAQKAGFSAAFLFCVHGRPLRSALLPPRVVLFQKSRGKFWQDGHAQSLILDGEIGELKSKLIHDDRKPLRRWLNEQVRYVQLEADKLHSSRYQQLDMADRLRLRWFIMPWLAPLYALFVKRTILDGWRGWHYAISRGLVELMLTLVLIDRALAGRERSASD